MTNVEKIMFSAKYNVKFMNGVYILSGFNHIKSIHIEEQDIYDILDDEKLVYFDEREWEDFVDRYKNIKEI